MIKIVTGPINTGKSTWIINDFKNKDNADGFVCRKVKINEEHIGYELMHLKTNEVCQFIRKIDRIPVDWNEALRLGMHYSFNKEGFEFANKITSEALAKNIKCFYLDEIGHLELKNQGFAEILRKLISAHIDLILVVRETLVENVCKTFNIKEFTTITPFFQK